MSQITGAVLGGFLGSVGQAGQAGIVGSLVQPLGRSTQNGINNTFPNQFPDASECVKLYYRGGCSWDELKKGLATNGIQLPTGGSDYSSAAWWERIIKRGLTPLPIDVALKSNALGNRSDQDLSDIIARYGFRSFADIGAIANQSTALDIGFIFELNAREIITDDEMVKFLKHAGYREETILKLLIKRSAIIDPLTTLTLLNRGSINDDDVTKWHKWAGYRDDDVRKQLKEMRWQWPSVAQLVQWAQLGALDNDRATKLGFDDEKPLQFALFARAAGQHWMGADQPPQNWPAGSLTSSDLSWRAHWRPNDVGTSITMLHRLRPTGGPNGGPRVPGVEPYTDDDLSADLAANGIPPGRRDQLKAVTYSLPRFSVFKTAMSAGVLTKDEVSEQLQDIGYNPATAKVLTDTWEHQAIQKQVDKLRPVSLSSVKEAYRLGTISRNDAARGLYIIYLSDYSQILDYFKLPLEAQYSLALGNGFVGIALTSIEADIAGELAKQAINVIKEGYMRLEIDATQAMSQLAQIGIVPQRAQQYVQLWTYEHAIKGIEVKAGELKKWYEDHLIDQPTYMARLTMLGYGQGDVALMVTRANLDMSERAMKLQAQTVKAAQLQARQLAAAAKAAAANQRAIQRAMCSSGTRNQVATWTVKGLITYPEGWKRLQECGMTPDDAINLLVTKQPKKGGLDLNAVKQKVGEQPTIGSAAK